MRDEPHDRARRGRAPCKPRRGDHRGCGRRIEGATKGAARQTPPPPAEGRGPRLVPATRGQRKENDKAPPPPHMPPPPQGWGLQEGRGGQRPPLSSGGGTGGAHAAWAGRRQGPRGVPHTPAGGQVPCHVPVPCLRRAYAGRRATRPPPPPRPHLPHPPRTEARATGRRRGGKRDDESVRRTPPRGHRGRVGRQRGETTVPKGNTRRASPRGGTAGGATAGRVG